MVKFPAVEIVGDRLMLTEAQKLQVRNMLSKQKAPYLQVTFQAPFRPRSTGRGSQSAKFHAIVAQICVQTQDDFERLKMELKQKAIARGWPFDVVHYKTPEGVLVEMSIAQSESRASVEQESILIDVAEQDAAEKGVVLTEE